MMSVHWVKADMRLRASRSDFDPRVRPLKPTVGGGQISGAYRRRTGGPGSSAKSSLFSEEKPHCFALSFSAFDPKADLAGSAIRSLSGGNLEHRQTDATDPERTSGQSAILMLLVLVQEFVLGCRFVPMGRRVLACFRPQWPNLNFADW